MKSKKVFLIFLILMFILRLEVVFPYEQNKNSDYAKLINKIDSTDCERYTRIRLILNKHKNIKEYKENLSEIFKGSSIDFKYVDKDSFQDIYKINTCNLYTKDKEDGYLIVLDFYLDKDKNNNFLSKAIDKMNLLFKDYKKDFSMENNYKIKFSNRYNIDDLKNIIEGYLSEMEYKFNSIKLTNGYGMEILLGGDQDKKIYLSLNKYNSGSYVIVGDSEIFISY